MRLHVLNTGNFKLDGGAMFGVVPKTIWQRTNPADENNLCTWSMRCLLVEDGNSLMLVDTGIGDKQGYDFLKHYFLSDTVPLKSGLARLGFQPSDVTDVFLTHLHFDHCGGALERSGDSIQPAFPRARYWSNPAHWTWATRPNRRERASFLTENIWPLQESGQLHMIDVNNPETPMPGMEIVWVSGHTEQMMIPLFRYKDHTLAFMADLLPSVGHIPLPYVMGYDTRPLLTLEEKAAFLNRAADERITLFFEHDAEHECCTVVKTEKGVRLERAFPLAEIL